MGRTKIDAYMDTGYKTDEGKAESVLMNLLSAKLSIAVEALEIIEQGCEMTYHDFQTATYPPSIPVTIERAREIAEKALGNISTIV